MKSPSGVASSHGALDAGYMTIVNLSHPGRFSIYFLLIGGLVEIATYRFSIRRARVLVVGVFGYKIALPLPLLF